ncbi:flocculation protein FLO11-like isoform X1 [Haliotis rufescens]|uniref:flocculation protein FLO11-like isoform X1 n=1 Tax=Haliotis rufescens TaxID=6454 RepID=UPI001EAFC050|nr:flocculation protein FLO11-like isoform X1 [Haliotis rufescens]
MLNWANFLKLYEAEVESTTKQLENQGVKHLCVLAVNHIQRMADSDCAVGVLVDLSVPDPFEEFLKNKDIEDKENVFPNNDPIEIARSDDSERRLSHTLQKPLELEDRILKDVTKTVAGNSDRNLKESPEIKLLDEETFDFDLAMSPQVSSSISKDIDEDDIDEEEVFFGPMGFTERIVAATVPVKDIKPMSPLNPAQIAQVVMEAHMVACRIANMKPEQESADEKSPVKCKLFSPNGRVHTRKGTFVIKDDEMRKQSPNIRMSIPCIDYDNSENIPVNSQCAPQTDRPVEDTISEIVSDGGRKKPNEEQVKEEKKPSRLTKLPRNRSYTLLKKAPSTESLDLVGPSERMRHQSSGSDRASETGSVASDNSDVPFTKPVGQVRGSLQQKLKAPVGKGSHSSSRMSRLQAPGGSSGLKKPSGMVKPGSSSALTVKNLQRASQVISDQQTQHHRSLSNSSNSSLGSSISNKSASHLPAKTGMPMKRLQLMQPSKIQKNSLALNRSKLSETSTKKSCGPMKAVAPSSTPHESIAKSPRQSTGTSMRTRGTPVKPDKSVQPKNLSSSFSTPVKAGSQSSYGQRTPCSERKEKRKSFLPTPNKSSTSSVPASPFSMRSSVSSNSSVSSHKSLSLTSESPVFLMDRPGSATRRRIPSGNTRRPLVQHTPDIPKQQVSRWSPVRRTRLLSKEDQAIQCTKRFHQTAKK